MVKKNIDYNSIGFKNSSIDKIKFREAFKKSRSSGQSQFTWNGKKYTTQTAEEKALTLSDKKLNNARSQAYEESKRKGFENSSLTEQLNSYTNEYMYRLQDEKNKGNNPRGSAYAKNRPIRLKRK